MNAYQRALIEARARGFYVPELECGWHRTAWDCGAHGCTPEAAVLAYHFDYGY